MKKFQILLLSCIVTALLISCQKEFTIDDFDPPVDPPADSAVLLKRYIRLDTTLTAPNDTVFTATYAYDNAGRCTSVFYKLFDHATLDAGTIQESIFYTGTDTAIAYRLMVRTDAAGTETEKEYLFYDAAGNIVKDSLYYNAISAVFFYRTDGNLIHSVAKLGSSSDSSLYSRHFLQKTNGNIVSEKDTVYEVLPTGHILDRTIINTASFDNAPNPLYKNSVHWPVMYEAEHILQGEYSFQQKNNYLSLYVEYEPGDSETYTYQYTYLANGYPSVARIHEVLTGSSATEHFYYKVLYQY